MATQVLWGVPYQVTIRATDLGSGKPVSNSWFLRADGSSGPLPVYGQPVAGGGDLNEVLTTFISAWDIIRGLLNHNYSTLDFTVRSIIGKKFVSPVNAIASLVSGVGVIVNTGTPHFLVTGQTVQIIGVTTPAAANGVWVITVTSPTQFTLNGSLPFLTWSGDGYWQMGTGEMDLLYGDSLTVASIATGGIAGDALPLFNTASVRRLNSGVGRHFRSRMSLSPMSESDSLDGGWITATKTAWATGLAAFKAAIVTNGSTDPGQDIMSDYIISPTLALGLVSPFTQAESWTKPVNSLALQRNAGSLVRRKPRLTAPIV